MPSPPESWSDLHDLALLYLALTHGADAALDASEKTAMQEKLSHWTNADPAGLEQVMSDVLLAYVSATSDEMVEAAAGSLRQRLGKPQRVEILNDLADMAHADGQVTPGEVLFIRQLASFWDVTGEIASDAGAAAGGASAGA